MTVLYYKISVITQFACNYINVAMTEIQSTPFSSHQPTTGDYWFKICV